MQGRFQGSGRATGPWRSDMMNKLNQAIVWVANFQVVKLGIYRVCDSPWSVRLEVGKS